MLDGGCNADFGDGAPDVVSRKLPPGDAMALSLDESAPHEEGVQAPDRIVTKPPKPPTPKGPKYLGTSVAVVDGADDGGR
jgi:hypothetical protein